MSLRKGLEDRTPFHFDYFAVHLGKDYSGLYGGVLMEETEYVSHCIERVLSLYKGKVKNVVLIGHSMVGETFIFNLIYIYGRRNTFFLLQKYLLKNYCFREVLLQKVLYLCHRR